MKNFKTKPFPGLKKDDLTGHVFSGLTVIGYAGGKTNCDGSRWVARCTCGNVEIRRAKRLKRQELGRAYYCQGCENEINDYKYERHLIEA